MVVAKTVPAQTRLVESLQRREITREYEAVAIGHMTAGGTVDEPISRHPTNDPYGGASDGQTSGDSLSHHGTLPCAHASAVASGNWTYAPDPRAYGPYHSSAGGRSGLWWPSASAKRCFGSIISTLRKFDRQALHATMLRLYHPISGIEMEWHAPIPQDMVELIEVMRADFEEHKDEVDWL